MTQPIEATTDIILHPYDSETGHTVPHVLIEELLAGRWLKFRAAVHFVKESGNYDELLSAMKRFLDGGGEIQLTFGADVFGRAQFASEYAAIEELLAAFEGSAGFSLHLYHEPGRTFHPKVYLFSNEPSLEALAIVGSSNWSAGGFGHNVEVSVKILLALEKEDHNAVYTALADCFDKYWSGPI